MIMTMSHLPNMKYRQTSLPDGTQLEVPQRVQRIDSDSTHGWQVRCQGTKFFSDGPGADPRASLVKAASELLSRMRDTSPESAMRQRNSPRKGSELPVGLSGPIVRERPGRARIAELSVVLPQFGTRPRIKSIYIASENTYSLDKFMAAVERGRVMREEATQAYEREAEKAHKRALTGLRAYLKSLREDLRLH
jgi:hypothetical protein